MKLEEAKVAYNALEEARGPVTSCFPLCTVNQYTGAVDDRGAFSGTGEIVSSMGFDYKGQLHKGQLDGTGAMAWKNGYTVSGPFKDGVANGIGKITWPNGDTYEGDLVNSVRQGNGCLYSEGGAAVYEGQWAHGKRHGVGRQKYPDGSVYHGDWKADKREGRGCLTYSTGDCYDGEWVDGQRHGYGEMGWKRGTTRYVELYDGAWTDGFPHGEGMSVYISYLDDKAATAAAAAATVEVEKNTNNNKTEEVPLCKFAPPGNSVLNMYHGHFVQGARDGWGTFYYADGSSYQGPWTLGRKNGMGKFTTAVGSVFYGLFVDDSPQDVSDLSALGAAAGIVPTVNISDLSSVADGDESMVTSTINSLLLRFNTALKDLFSRYAAKSDNIAFLHTPDSWWRHRVPGHISIPQFLRLLNDAKVINGMVTTASVIRSVIEAIDEESQHSCLELEADPMEQERVAAMKASVYRLSGSINYRLFAEALVRLSPRVCLGPSFATLGQKYNALVEQHLKGKHLGAEPVCPLSREKRAIVVPYLGQLEDQFNALVDLELSCAERFLPTRSFIKFIRPILENHEISLVEAIKLLFPFNKYPSIVSVPPGLNEPLSDLAHSIYKQSCSYGDANSLAEVSVRHELTLVDYIEAIVRLVTSLGEDDEEAQAFIEIEVLALTV